MMRQAAETRFRRQKGAGQSRLTALFAAWLLAILCSLTMAATALAADAGTYTVTVKPSYTDPETGRVEDPGNNEAIGQGMTEKLCGPTGLLEVGADGSMYLTVRYYLSQFVTDVSFEERNGGSYTSLSFQAMQTKAPVEGSTNIDEKYGYTDYRMKIQNTASVFRGKAYIEPMGRSVVYFFTFSNPVAGSADFKTSLANQAAQTQTQAAVRETEAAVPVYEEEALQEEAYDGEALHEAADEEEAAEEVMPAQRTIPDRPQRSAAATDDGINGSGNADDPVTGIPQKPGTSGSSRTEAQTSRAGSSNTGGGAVSASDYHLDTDYDLSQVPMQEARELTEPILAEATGITGMTGDTELSALDAAQEKSGMTTNQKIMYVLLAAAGALILWFGAAQLRRRPSASPDEEEAPEEAEQAADEETAAEETAEDQAEEEARR
ncbi:MAG: heme-binding Shp domain-containing protein [Eubacteriales bacterium]|nr:heme-binding Shp domain-containing protein [Eubacteriales bacterium]